MTKEQLLSLAAEEGFSAASVLPTCQIRFEPAFREYCRENLCGQYGRNESCPPGCGTPEQMQQRALAHGSALVLQTIWELPDFSDFEAIIRYKLRHTEAERRLVRKLRSRGCDGILISAGACALCDPCAQNQGQPCRFPRERYSCMSAYCIHVQDLARQCGMTYTWDDGKLSFFGMYVYD